MSLGWNVAMAAASFWVQVSVGHPDSRGIRPTGSQENAVTRSGSGYGMVLGMSCWGWAVGHNVAGGRLLGWCVY